MSNEDETSQIGSSKLQLKSKGRCKWCLGYLGQGRCKKGFSVKCRSENCPSFCPYTIHL
jgi:hypothetical protein